MTARELCVRGREKEREGEREKQEGGSGEFTTNLSF